MPPRSQELAYREFAVSNSGRTLSRQDKFALREKHGYCTTCEGVPVQLFTIKKSAFNPLARNKEPCSVAGESLNGQCLICRPDLDPNHRSTRFSRHAVRPKNPSLKQQSMMHNSSNNNISDPFSSPQSSVHSSSGPASCNLTATSSSTIDTDGIVGTNGHLHDSRRSNMKQSRQAYSDHLIRRTMQPDNSHKTWHPTTDGQNGNSSSSNQFLGKQEGFDRPIRNWHNDYDQQSNNSMQRGDNMNCSRRIGDESFRNDIGRSSFHSTPEKSRRYLQMLSSSSPSLPNGMGKQQHSMQAREDDVSFCDASMESQISLNASFHESPPPIGSPRRGRTDSRRQLHVNINVPPFDMDSRSRPNGLLVRQSSNGTSSLSSTPYIEEASVYSNCRSEMTDASSYATAQQTHNGRQVSWGLESSNNMQSSRSQAWQTSKHSSSANNQRSARVVRMSDSFEEEVITSGPSSSRYSNDERRHGGSEYKASDTLSLDETQSTLSTYETSDVNGEAITNHATKLIRQLGTEDADVIAEVILSTMRQYTDNAYVQIYGLTEIWNLSNGNNSGKEVIINAGAIPDIIAAMRTFHDSDALNERACSALWSLVTLDHHRVTIAESGVCEHLVAAINKFFSNTTLVHAAVATLRTLSQEPTARKQFHALKAPAATVRAMTEHQSHLPLQRDGCAFLTNCATNIEEQRVDVAPFEELNAIVQAVRTHKDNKNFLSAGCFALKNFSWDSNNCRTLRQCPGFQELVRDITTILEIAASEGAPFDATKCQSDIEFVKERMDLSKAEDESLEDQQSTLLLDIIESEGKAASAFERVIWFMSTNSWSPKLLALAVHNLTKLVQCRDDWAERPTSRGNYCSLQIPGVLKDVFQRLSKHEHDTELMQESCQLVAALANGFDRVGDANYGLRMLIEDGSCHLLFRALLCHLDEESVAKEALIALAPFSVYPDCWTCNEFDAKEGYNKIQLVTEVIDAHPNCGSIQMHGSKVLLNCLDSGQ